MTIDILFAPGDKCSKKSSGRHSF